MSPGSNTYSFCLSSCSLRDFSTMGWWHKMRRVWISVSARVKQSRKSGGTGGGKDGRSASGLLSLRDDVQMCGYKDVQVMWNMLYKSSQEQEEASAHPSNPKCSKQRFTWRFLFWPGHTTSSSSSSSSLSGYSR